MFIVIIFCLINMVAVTIKPNNNNQEQNIQQPLKTIEYEDRIFVKTAIINKDNNKITTENISKEQLQMKLTKKQDLGQNIVNYAFSFVGQLPYVWGGASLEYGADCCGFTMALYQQFGISIPRTVEDQAFSGYSVSLQDARPGDIIIYHGHVGLYIGYDTIIHSPSPGQYVSIASVYIKDIVDIRRIVE